MQNGTTEASPVARLALFKYRLRTRRKYCKLTQGELGAMCKIPGSHVSHFERGIRLPSCENLVKLASALNVTTDYLLAQPSSPVEDYLDMPSFLRRGAD